MAELCPDEARVLADIRAAGGSIKPSKLRAMYRRITANADADHDHGSGPTYTDRRRRASLPADLAVGERVAARMAGGAST